MTEIRGDEDYDDAWGLPEYKSHRGKIIVSPHLIEEGKPRKLSKKEFTSIYGRGIKENENIVYIVKYEGDKEYVVVVLWGDSEGTNNQERFYLHELDWVYNFIHSDEIQSKILLDEL